MKKVRVSIARDMIVSEEDFEWLLGVVIEGNGQAFEEFTEISWEGTFFVEEIKDE